MNIWVHAPLYTIAAASVVVYFTAWPRARRNQEYYIRCLVLWGMYCAGASVALASSFAALGSEVWLDLARSFAFPLIFIVTGLVARNTTSRRSMWVAAWGISSLMMLVFVSTVFLGADSTVVGYVTAIAGFFGLFLMAQGKHSANGRVIAFVAWSVALLSLRKWLLLLVVGFPLLWILVRHRQIGSVRRTVAYVCLVLIGGAALVTVRDVIASYAGYSDWAGFWFGRVVAGAPGAGIEFVLRDTGRFEIWADLWSRFWRQPMTGLGLGVRALDQPIEDHNMYLFFLVRFGLPVFLAFAGSVIVMLHFIMNGLDRGSPERIILVALWGYYFFAGAVGQAYGQLPVSLILGLVTGLVLGASGFSRAQSRTAVT